MQALLEFQATTPDGLCTQAATDAVRTSVVQFLRDDGVTAPQVSVECFNANGTLGNVAVFRIRRTSRGLLQVRVPAQPWCMAAKRQPAA